MQAETIVLAICIPLRAAHQIRSEPAADHRSLLIVSGNTKANQPRMQQKRSTTRACQHRSDHVPRTPSLAPDLQIGAAALGALNLAAAPAKAQICNAGIESTIKGSGTDDSTCAIQTQAFGPVLTRNTWYNNNQLDREFADDAIRGRPAEGRVPRGPEGLEPPLAPDMLRRQDVSDRRLAEPPDPRPRGRQPHARPTACSPSDAGCHGCHRQPASSPASAAGCH